MTTTEARRLNKKLADLAHGRSHTLAEFLTEASALHPEIAEALSGIWCGRTGNVFELLPDGRRGIVVDWYEGRVEASYLS